ncbi:MAG TPA: PIG-L deacetylase family protein [Vicinamibacterales bacterium]|nr:PIG-L deacetylase family protein [Vicinamibacterales bacterium]
MTGVASAAAANGRVLLGVFAHPDDESLACGGLLARCASLGVVTTLLCLTRGEAGPGVEPHHADETAARRRLGALRTRELDAAARVLGLGDVVVLDHEDGMLPWLAPEVLEADIRAAIERLRPDAVVTFGADGLYWHPDHVAVHERTTAVVTALGAAAPALYYVTLPPGQMRAVGEHAAVVGGVVPGLDDLDAFGALAAPPTVVIDAGPFAERKLAALMCHRSQMADSPIARIAARDAGRLLGTEHFRRAAVGATTRCFLDALGAAAD